MSPPTPRPGRRTRGLAALLAVVLLVTAACSPVSGPGPGASGGAPVPRPSGAPGAGPDGAPAGDGVPRDSGQELYGFLPWWELDDGIAEHLAGTPLTTIGLFSVTHTGRGELNTGQPGYRAVTGALAGRVVDEARDRGVRVELVYSSFGSRRNRRLLEDEALRQRVVGELVALAGRIGVDGVNVDVEGLDAVLVPAYGTFVAELRVALEAADPGARVSVATSAGLLGAAMAAAAVAAGADRVFLMGYDYRTAESAPGASAPLDRRDGGETDLAWSLDAYAALGVPEDRLLLGLPLYGMAWPVTAPELGAPATGRGRPWIPSRDPGLLAGPRDAAVRDEVEQVEVWFLVPGATAGTPPPAPPGPPEIRDRTWQAVYVDSPETLAPKLALARQRALAAAGFWAIGYERGVPGFTRLMERFAAGRPLE